MLGVGAGLGCGCGAAARAGLAAAVAPRCAGESLCHSLHFGLVAGIAAPRLADWELARLVAQPLAERRLRRYGLSILPSDFLPAVLVRTRLTGIDVADRIERGRRTDGRRTDGLASGIADGLDAEHGLNLLEQRFELDGRLWSRPQVAVQRVRLRSWLRPGRPPTLH